ncbi:MAG: hypothetical protein AB1705_25765 [Verrucomicrobiota bacterium]
MTSARFTHFSHTLAASLALAVFLPVFSATAAEPQRSGFDAWDVTLGSTITTSSLLYPGSNAGDLLGGSASSVERGNVIFRDGLPDGTVHSVEWQTAAPVTVRSFRIFASHDFTPNRAFRQMNLYAFDAASSAWVLIYTVNPTIPYGDGSTGAWLILTDSVTPVTSDQFRAEFVQHLNSGPRIIELDGFETETAPDELWDALGVTVQATSGLRAGSNGLDMFGASFGSPEPGNVLFQDGQPAGFTHSIVWKSAAPVTVRSFSLSASYDLPSPPQRAFSTVRLFGWDAASASWTLLFEHDPVYDAGPFGNTLYLSANLPPMQTDQWRAEFVQAGGMSFSGPRVWDLEGYAQAFPQAVQIDIKPGVSPNEINLKAKGKTDLPVGVFSTAIIDATRLDLSTVTLGDPRLSGVASPTSITFSDLNGDGRMDGVLHFMQGQLISNGALNSSTTELQLLGVTLDGAQFYGSDSVVISGSGGGGGGGGKGKNR